FLMIWDELHCGHIFLGIFSVPFDQYIHFLSNPSFSNLLQISLSGLFTYLPKYLRVSIVFCLSILV
ncbi:MAG: hypothetical protein ACK481_02905, partial [Candidatus Melainabacteria bacterium]